MPRRWPSGPPAESMSESRGQDVSSSRGDPERARYAGCSAERICAGEPDGKPTGVTIDVCDTPARRARAVAEAPPRRDHPRPDINGRGSKVSFATHGRGGRDGDD